MTTIGNRPTTVISHLENINTGNLYVQCRLPSGEDGYVAFSEIVKLVQREIVRETRVASGTRQETHNDLAKQA